jgi:thiamine biosynthesis protein ThiI
MERAILVHYAEIGLKGGNRPQFVRRLADRLRQGLGSAGLAAGVGVHGSRLMIRLEDPAVLERALRVVTRIPGVANAAPAACVGTDLEAIGDAAVEALARAPEGSFKVETRRGDKQYPLNSIEVSQAVGARCAAASERPVDVHRPDVTVRIEITRSGAYVSAGALEGPGGLPVGSTTSLLAFLSGGLDSPVAAWRMIRRGARVTAVHFHNRTFQGGAVLEKIEDLCAALAWAAGKVPLLVVPFEGCQREIVARVPASHRMIVYRRAMFRIGAALAARERALGYITGDSLGQVASQTAENLMTIHAAADRPVYAPLVGSDKREIIEMARRIGTYDVSIRPHDDCCTYLIAKRPAVRSTVAEIEAMEAGIDWDALVAAAVAGTREQVLRPDPATIP